MKNLSPAIAKTIADWPDEARSHLANVRQAILTAAADMPEVGPITETLKWREPAWLTEASKSGTTIRAAWSPKRPEVFGIYLNCRTTLVTTMRELYPSAFTYDGTRALLSPRDTALPEGPLDHCIRMALTYHRTA